MARDGYSGKIVGASVMPCKNNEANVYREANLAPFTCRRDYAVAVGFSHMFRPHPHAMRGIKSPTQLSELSLQWMIGD